MSVQTTGYFTFANWEERAVGSSGASLKLAHASVTNTFSGGIEAADTTCEYAIVYVTEKTGTFAGMEVLTGSLEGREGTFAVEERGSFDADGTVHCTFQVVPGSGSGELTGLRGTGSFTAKHGESSVPYTFDYDLGLRPVRGAGNGASNQRRPAGGF
ncbi:DUF3224 domain-containing protein [Streptomyces sp. UNOC14_S4]|uniref:DUF3224 domain-containing protein n=1 Tax=Streptomyces sp. UNOC14_S4 TaxID=2872340 RepID=UPI0027E311DE|nr:DUF3224 domain-containing protein [Streptomyces sp. UNOC14_S4]MCC3769828.1 DUF3224 domain-containing protein [Streptomyces sp. UNOC14_S4]